MSGSQAKVNTDAGRAVQTSDKTERPASTRSSRLTEESTQAASASDAASISARTAWLTGGLIPAATASLKKEHPQLFGLGVLYTTAHRNS
jgi:hypothetical protein